MKTLLDIEERRIREVIDQDNVAGLEAIVDEGLPIDRTVAEPGASEGRTLLERACEAGSGNVVEFLIRSRAKLDKGRSKPLHSAILFGHSEIVELLLEAGADPNSTISDDEDRGLTPLMYATDKEGKPEILDCLLNRGADPHALTKKGASALSIAVERDNRHAIGKLLQAGCRARGPELLRPTYTGDLELIKAMLRAGADVNVTGTGDTCLPNQTPLDGAIQARAIKTLFTKSHGEKRGMPTKHELDLQHKLEIIRELIKAGAQINRCTYLQSPLFSAATEGDLELVDLLLESGASPDESISVAVATKLKEGGNKWGRYKNAALHAAVEKGFVEVVRRLIEAGADVNKPDYAGHTPLDLAEASGHSAIVELLKRSGGKANARQLSEAPGN